MYEQASLQVRPDLAAAHDQAFQRLAQAGTWFSGAERLAIARETRRARHCALCAERKAALSPNHVAGNHDSVGDLAPVLVEQVHRIATDPGRLTEAWYHGLLAAGLADTSYVEGLSVVATTIAVDTFARAIGTAEAPLPAAVAGAASRQRPASATHEGSWVPTIPRGANTGPEADLYAGGFVPNVRRAMSLVPDAVRQFFQLLSTQYLANLAFGEATGRAISRAQIELLAARVSALNRCFY